MNLGTVREKIKADTHRISTEDHYHIYRAIEYAIRKYYRISFNWNKGETMFRSSGQKTAVIADGDVVGTDNGYPSDLLRIVRVAPWDRPWQRMRPMSLATLQDTYPSRRTDDGKETTGFGSPKIWAYEDKILYIRPITEEAVAYQLEYIRDIGLIKVAFLEGNWITTVDGVKVDDDYTNAWLDEGQDLIIEVAKFRLFTSVYADVERAQAAQYMEKDLYKNLIARDRYAEDPPPAEAWV
jgi:hypothetical protein